MATLMSNQIQLNYHDTGGDGFPIILIHGWPTSANQWNAIAEQLSQAGFRVIAYDRRGFGQSDKPDQGYDYDTFVCDLDGLVNALGLEHFGLAGFSMGGGEVAHYLRRHPDRVLATVYIASITPNLNFQDPDYPAGTVAKAIAEMRHALKADPDKFFTDFVTKCYSISESGTSRLMVKPEIVDQTLADIKQASMSALLQTMETWMSDFRSDLLGTQRPTLVLHGLSDQIVPFELTGARMNNYTKAQVTTVGDGPHGLLASHPDFLAYEMIKFLKRVIK